MTASDTSRAIQHDPDRRWPDRVRIELVWYIDGAAHVQAMAITAEEFFGLNGVGAPMEGSALIGRIENLRRQGPPSLGGMMAKATPSRNRPVKKVKNAKK